MGVHRLRQHADPDADERRLAAGAAAALPASTFAQAASRSSTDTAARTQSSMVKLDKRSPRLGQVTIANPPFNLVVPEIVSALHAIVQDMDRDPEVKIIVFRSEIEG